ncbi:hypothetical protein ACEWY4_019201 [Coilia grayii]|uniref:Podocin n=1 Tax=Coilia grayii TaxID=363190 RepID=A0ABD1JIC1_9TELE
MPLNKIGTDINEATEEVVEDNTGEDGPSCGSGLCGILLMLLSVVIIIVTFPFTIWSCLKIVAEYERAVIFRLGRIVGGAKGPGILWVIPCVDTFRKVDMRTVSFNIPPQELNSVTIMVDAVVYYRVFNPVVNLTQVEDANMATQMIAQTTLRNMLGTKSLAELLMDREEMAEHMEAVLYDASKHWGIKVERVELKDVKLPQSLQRAMAAEAEASREARAKVIAAEGEMKASRALKEAAEVMSQSPSALQLRYLQTLSEIASEKNSTIIFPIPLDMMETFTRK